MPEKTKIIRITTDNEVSVREFPTGNYAERQKTLCCLIGGMCEIAERVKPKRLYRELGMPAAYNDHVVMLVDEEGAYHELPVNLIGSFLYETDKHGYPILGNILFAAEQMTWNGFEITGLSDEQFTRLYTKLKNLSDQLLSNK